MSVENLVALLAMDRGRNGENLVELVYENHELSENKLQGKLALCCSAQCGDATSVEPQAPVGDYELWRRQPQELHYCS